MKTGDYQTLLSNKILKERSRLLILSYLIASDTNSAGFMPLQKALDLSRGNLSVQIQTLKDAGYVTVSKTFKDNKPLTTVAITGEGIGALKGYLEEMEEIIRLVKEVRE